MDGGTRTTASGGSVTEPWAITFPTAQTRASIRIAETMKAGHRFVEGQCTITPRVGDPLTVPITDASVTLQGESPTNRSIRPGDQVECEFVNQLIPGSVTWQKVNEGAGEYREHLAASEWLLTGPRVPEGAQTITDCVAEGECGDGPYDDKDPRPGHFELDQLHAGNYALIEHQAPPGYETDSTVHRFIIESTPETCRASEIAGGNPKCLHVDFDAPFVNRLQTVPQIPLTGGLSTDAFIGVGAGLGALGLIAGFFLSRRRSNQS